jgi:hypothetical protein
MEKRWSGRFEEEEIPYCCRESNHTFPFFQPVCNSSLKFQNPENWYSFYFRAGNVCAWFQVSVAKYLRSMLFWDITQSVVLIYRRFGTTYRSHLQGSRIQREKRLDSWPFKTGSIGCPETSLRNYHFTLRNNPEERSSQEMSAFVELHNTVTNVIPVLMFCVRFVAIWRLIIFS